MADDIAAALPFTLTASSGMAGAPTFHAQGDLEPVDRLKVTEAKITQAVTPPHGVKPIEDPSGSWKLEPTPNLMESLLVLTIKGKVEGGNFDSTSTFPVRQGLNLQKGLKLEGKSSFSYGSTKIKDVPVELNLR